MKNTFASFFVFALISGTVPFSLAAQQRSASGSAQYAEELTANLSRQVRSVQDENARLEMQLSEVERRITVLERENKELSEALLQVKRQAAAESAARDEQIRKLSDQIVKLATLPPPAPPVPPASSSSTKKGAQKAESTDYSEYEEYVVVQGATLSAIAAAYKVSIADIKKANNLKSDVLRVGQKLRIPVK